MQNNGVFAIINKNGIFIKVLVFYFDLRELPKLFIHQNNNVPIDRNESILTFMNIDFFSSDDDRLSQNRLFLLNNIKFLK